MSDERLTRIETKLDTLAEAVVSLARMEERMVTLFKRMDKYEEAQTRAVDRLNEVEKKVFGGGLIGGLAEKAVFVVLGAGLAWLLKGNN